MEHSQRSRPTHEASPSLTAKVQPPGWGKPQIESSPLPVHDFSHVDLFSHAPQRSPVQLKLNAGHVDEPSDELLDRAIEPETTTHAPPDNPQPPNGNPSQPQSVASSRQSFPHFLPVDVFTHTPQRSPVQMKLTVGEPNDVYEQEADRVAQQLMSMAPPATPNVQRQPDEEEIQTKSLVETITPLVQRQEAEEDEPIQAKGEDYQAEEPIQRFGDRPAQPPIQRESAPEEEELQTKPLAASITPLLQREAMPEEEELQTKASGNSDIQRMDNLEEEELQTKPGEPASIQREDNLEEEELQTKPVAGTVQQEDMPEEEALQTQVLENGWLQREEMPEEEAVQTKSLVNTLQRQEMPEEEEAVQTKPSLQRATDGSLQAGGNLESRLDSSQGGGSPLPQDVIAFMESRFRTDFSQVRVHTDSKAVQMNRDLNAQAFTHKQDVYFGAGKTPGKDALTAHELTHVVQQTQLIQRKAVDLIQRESSPPSGVNPTPRRIDLVFIMGKDIPRSPNRFYTAAKKYWSLLAPQAQMIQSDSLEGIFNWLRLMPAKVGNVYIVSHANADGTLSFKLDASDKDTKISYGELKQALKNKAALFKLSGQLDRDSTIHIKGCNIGRSKAMLDTLDQAFGGTSKVTAPTHKQKYSYQSISKGKGKNRKVEEKTQELFNTLFIERIGKVKLSRTEQLTEFKTKYTDLGWEDKTWGNLIPKEGLKPTVHEPFRYTYPVGINPAPSEQTVINEAQKDFAGQISSDPNYELSRPDMYVWRVERSGKGKSFKMIAILSMTSYTIDKDLKDSSGNMIHPTEQAGSYFGESTYQPPKSP